MQPIVRIQAGLTAALLLVSAEAVASGVGAALYVPRSAPAQPAVRPASCETCPPQAACGACQRLGFACVDHATPAPCTAEGGCYPKRNTFGYYPTQWRRWPGADYGGPAPEEAGPADGIDVIVPPAAEDEDQQAPTPIEDTIESDEPPVGGGGFDGEGFEGNNFEPPAEPAFDRPGVEIDLPPLPEGPLPTRPALPQRPGPPGQQGQPGQPGPQNTPPALPFGSNNAPRGLETDGWGPPAPPFEARPVALPKPLGSDAPPPLPHGFTHQAPEELIRRLPTIRSAGRYDGAVRPVSAEQPIR